MDIPICKCGTKKTWSNERGYECPYCSKGLKPTDELCPLCQSPLTLDMKTHEYLCETGGCPYFGIDEDTHCAITMLIDAEARKTKYRDLLERVVNAVFWNNEYGSGGAYIISEDDEELIAEIRAALGESDGKAVENA